MVSSTQAALVQGMSPLSRKSMCLGVVGRGAWAHAHPGVGRVGG